MNTYEILLILFSGSLLAGFLGSLTGLGGAVIIVPLLTLVLNVDIHYAIGASLIAVIATSTASSGAYVKHGFTNIYAGVLLETATCLGATLGVVIGTLLPASVLSLIFGLFLAYASLSSFYIKQRVDSKLYDDKLAIYFKLNGSYPTKEGNVAYGVKKVPAGYAVMFLAGSLSGILGIGSGPLKVLALDTLMGFPFKVSTTTSNFMIGVTAAASAGFYFQKGYIDPLLSLPIMLGIVAGSIVGTKLLVRMHALTLRKIFACMLLLVASQMIYQGVREFGQ